MLLFSIFSFIFGCFIGSFLCVLADRLPRGEQFLKGRSKCEKCHHVLSAFDLIPVVSYLMLGGKCRFCHTKIPIHLLFTELLTGIAFLAVFLYVYYLSLPLVLFLVLIIPISSYIGMFIADANYGIIPDEFIGIAIIGTLIYLYISNPATIIAHFFVGICTLIFFLILFFATRGRGMGFGDVKLSLSLGFFLGFPNIIIGLYSAFLTAAIVSVILIILKKKKLRGDTIPFGPFLVIGTLLAFFAGSQIWIRIFG
jgi:prepilin signal peptidase PulO-like enzyme (type II secretory pathway)